MINGTQQQWITRNSNIDGWTNGVWNQVFSGVVGAPAQCFPEVAPCNRPYTTLATSPVTREEPYLYLGFQWKLQRLRAGGATQFLGCTWAAGPTPGSSIPIDRFYIAQPTDSVEKINVALLFGKNLILTPGIYELDQRHHGHTYPDTVVLGLGFPTLIPQTGNASMSLPARMGCWSPG